PYAKDLSREKRFPAAELRADVLSAESLFQMMFENGLHCHGHRVHFDSSSWQMHPHDVSASASSSHAFRSHLSWFSLRQSGLSILCRFSPVASVSTRNENSSRRSSRSSFDEVIWTVNSPSRFSLGSTVTSGSNPYVIVRVC